MEIKSKKLYFLLASAFLLIVFLFVVWTLFTSFSAKSEKAFVFIDKDDTVDSVYVKLSEKASAGKLTALKMCSSLTGYSKNVHPGKYSVGEGTTTFQLFRNLRGARQTPVDLVIPVAHTIGDLAGKLSKQLEADSLSLVQTFSDTLLLKELDVKLETAPCLFIPNTYQVYWDITPEKLLRRMKRERDDFWTFDKIEKAKSAGLTPDEAYTLASIVEQESANTQERSLIAGMYINRLKQGMKLQADPTVKFALQNFSLRRILLSHLSVDSPYNTYKYIGLPIGPICIPSLNAINSVLNYAHHPYLYMCAKEDFSGTHNFAGTYAEHQANAKKYAQALNERGIK